MEINGKTRLLGLLGDPVEHTMSPVIHNTLSDILGMNEVYVPFHTDREGLAAAVSGAYELNVLGLNATVPHKNSVMDVLVDIDEGARAIGAVNTLVRVQGGYKGYNTDMLGLARELDTYGVDLCGRTAVILGAGGAARAVAYMCMDRGAAKVFILNRTLEKAQEIADDMNRHFGRDDIHAMKLDDYMDLKAEYVQAVSSGNSSSTAVPDKGFIVFQSTSIGLSPNDESVVISDRSFYDMVSIGIDLIYNPFETTFMRLCKEAGAASYNGLRMLLYQGIIAYELWNDISVSEDVADMVYERLEKTVRDNVVLIGFMGCGKTTIGTELAKRRGSTLVDVDSYIESQEGCSINNIFDVHGEEYFRSLETRTLRCLNESVCHCVISTGGGLPMRDENREELRKLGTIIYLDVTPEEVVRRLAGDTTRPLLLGDDVNGKVRRLMDERRPVYESLADYTVPVGGRSAGDIVEEILCILKNQI